MPPPALACPVLCEKFCRAVLRMLAAQVSGGGRGRQLASPPWLTQERRRIIAYLALARARKRANQLKCKPGFGDERCTAPVRDQASRIGNEINASTRPRVRIAGKDKTVFFRQIGVVVA
jgi:hypothetical protein